MKKYIILFGLIYVMLLIAIITPNGNYNHNDKLCLLKVEKNGNYHYEQKTELEDGTIIYCERE
jgi:uncharacterized ion transporter superfamily protein YfcC